MRARLDSALWRVAIRAYEGGVRRRPVFRYWRELQESQWRQPAELAALQFNRLRALLSSAGANSPWYRDTWSQSGLTPGTVQTLADFHRWPIIDRETVRLHRMAMRSTAGLQLITKATGGSSGVPLQFDFDVDSNERRMAAWHRGYAWAGAPPGTRQWYLWGSPPSTTAAWRHWKGKLYDTLYRRTMESSFHLANSELERLHQSLARTRPDTIVAYAGAIYSFARMLESDGRIPYSPASIIVGAEKLHHFQREVIERVFRAPVFETYGSREFMLIGAECEVHQGLHLTSENLLVELLDDKGSPVAPGEEGNVVVTDLTNHGMPFIRYANGDRATAATTPCPCGRGLPLLAEVAGRQLDVLETPAGGRLPGEFFPHLLKEISAVKQYRVIQERLDLIQLQLVAPEWTHANEAWLRNELASVAPGVILEVHHMTTIPLTAAGKQQVVINRVHLSSKHTT